MPSANIALADAVAANLTAASETLWSEPFVAVSKRRIDYKVEELANLKVTVISSGDDSERISRGNFEHNYRIAVLIQQKLEVATEEVQSAALIELGEMIADFYNDDSVHPDPVDHHNFDHAEYAPFFNKDHLKRLGVLTTVVELIFKGWR